MVLKQDTSGSYIDMLSTESGFSVPGEIRSIKSLIHDGKLFILIARTDKPIQILTLNS